MHTVAALEPNYSGRSFRKEARRRRCMGCERFFDIEHLSLECNSDDALQDALIGTHRSFFLRLMQCIRRSVEKPNSKTMLDVAISASEACSATDHFTHVQGAYVGTRGVFDEVFGEKRGHPLVTSCYTRHVRPHGPFARLINVATAYLLSVDEDDDITDGFGEMLLYSVQLESLYGVLSDSWSGKK